MGKKGRRKSKSTATAKAEHMKQPEESEGLAINSEYHTQVVEAKVHQHPNGSDEIVKPKPNPKEKAKYMKQLQDSEGFDVDVLLTDGGSDGDAIIVPIDMSQANGHELWSYSKKAGHAYNQKGNGSNYRVTKVVKACSQAVFGVMYYITFEAINSERHTQVFQAKVHKHPSGSNEIVMVRPKPPTSSSFYNRIIQRGYGPKDKLDSVAAWRIYFDRTFPVKRLSLILKVFADDLPKGWNPLTIRVEWLNGVDKDVTSRSPAFVTCPHYQYMWQNGYAPPDGKNLDPVGWATYRVNMPDDEQEKMHNALFSIPEDPGYEAEIWKAYCDQVNKTQGFDVDVYVDDESGTIMPMFHDMAEAKYCGDLIDYSTKALVVYNKDNDTDYTVTEVLKACHRSHQNLNGYTYYITFQASNSEVDIKVFQARVHETMSEEKIELVRIKPENS